MRHLVLLLMAGGIWINEPLSATTIIHAGRLIDGRNDEVQTEMSIVIENGAITEVELTRLLGSARAFRRFSLEFESHARQVPFKVRIETAASGKRYMKDGEG